MFKHFFRKKTDEELTKQQSHSALPESCKRAIGFFPEASPRSEDIKDTVALRFHHLLVSLEGSERTGCLKISSPHYKSRSALLLFRGRVVGAVYGRKSMQGQILYEDAHKWALGDLAAPGNTLDAYELPEDLVLAAASLFYGETLETNYSQSLEVTFDYALSSLTRSGRPGCLVVSSLQEETICIVYVANGRIVGVFSASDGWIQDTAESAKRFLRGGRCKINAAVLPVLNQHNLGFSLTGLGDLPGATIDATPYQDFSPAPSAIIRTQSREAVAKAVHQHRGTGEITQAGRRHSYARV